MKTVIIILLFLLGLWLPSTVEAKAWRGIVPLQTTKGAVLQILGKGTDSKSPGTKYDFEIESVFILYSSGDTALAECARKLSPDLVLSISVFPKVELSLEALGLQRETLRTLPPPPDSPHTTAFIDDDNGLVVSVNDGTQQVTYLPSKGDRPGCADFYGDLSSFVIRRPLCILCPTLSVDCPEESESGSKITFTAHVTQGTPALEIAFHWTVDQGTIVEGQGTASIKVDTTNLAGKTITATVEVNGIDSACPRTASCSTPIVKRRKRSQD